MAVLLSTLHLFIMRIIIITFCALAGILAEPYVYSRFDWDVGREAYRAITDVDMIVVRN